MVLTVVAVMLATLTAWVSPDASAQAARRCADMYDIQGNPPEYNQLPGIEENHPKTPNPNRRIYDYDNPAEAVRGLELPRDPEAPDDYGNNTVGKAPGTKEHIYAAWNRYVERKARDLKQWESNGKQGKKPRAALPWEKWRNLYIRNQGNPYRGAAYEKLAVKKIRLGGDDWICQDTVGDRKFDAVNHKQKVAYEFKSGRGVDKKQVLKDAQLARKYKIVYVFGQEPTNTTKRTLANHGLRSMTGWHKQERDGRCCRPTWR